MKMSGDGLPEVGATARTLGVRVGIDIVAGPDGLVRGGFGGLSVVPDSPRHLPEHRRPPEFGGISKDNVWVIAVSALGPDLVYREDADMPGAHGFVEPARAMRLVEYERASALIRDAWRLP